MSTGPEGRWLPPPAEPHRCKLPTILIGTPAGARWECACGATYEVVMQMEHNETFRQFRRLS